MTIQIIPHFRPTHKNYFKKIAENVLTRLTPSAIIKIQQRKQEENKMDKKSYRELMIAVLKLQMVDWSEIENEYQEGINRGLEIAIEKLQCSSFLTDTE